METFSGRFWEIPGNVLKLELLKMFIDHKNALVFFQAVSGKSSWSFSHRWTQYQREKNSYSASVHRTFSQRREKQGCFFSYFFVWVPIFDPTLVQYFIQIPHIIFVPLYQHMINDDLSKKISTFSGKVFSSELGSSPNWATANWNSFYT